MSRVGWANANNLGPAFRWSWINADDQVRGEVREGLPADMAHAFVQELPKAWAEHQDLLVLPMRWVERGFGVLVSDMDSTLIKQESLDELAEALGVGPQVAEITVKSMRGDLDFATALDQRFQLIKGVHRDEFRALGHATELSPGAEEFVQALIRRGTHCTLATGGFDIIAHSVVERLGMQDYVANSLAFDDGGKFLATLAGPLLDANAKLDTLNDRIERVANGKPTIAMGDGANDLAMIGAADLGIAYRAKPVVREATAYQLNFASLAGLGKVLGE